jgi:transcriptional regulator with XRE-family HTH domain
MSIAANIKQRREAKRWTQAELAEKSGIVTQAMISRKKARITPK